MRPNQILIVLLVIFLFLDFGILKAQDNFNQYIVIDTVYRMGVVTVLNKDQIEFKTNKSTQLFKVYTAAEVLEFGISDGRIFYSFNINGKRRFVQKLSKGKMNLFKYDSIYFLIADKDSAIMTKKNYKEVIHSKTDCSKLKFIPFRKGALKSLADQYNANGCKIGFIPYSKFGLVAGIAPYTLKAKVTDLTTDSYSSTGVTGIAGVLADFAFHRPKNLVLSMELLYFKVKGSFNDSITTNFQSVMMPIGLKWYCGSPFYFKAGTIISRNTSHSIGPYFDIKDSHVAFGLQLGAGVDFPVSDHNNIHFELKYFNLNNKGNDFISVNSAAMTFLAGITF